MIKKPERVKKDGALKKNGPKKPRRVKKMDLRKKNQEKKGTPKNITFLGYPIRVILLVIFFSGKTVGKKLRYY